MKIVSPLIFVLILAVLQITVVSKIHIFGIRPNLVLIGIFILFLNRKISNILLGAVIGGLIYDINDFYIGLNTLIFILMVLVFWFLGRRYIVGHNFLSLLIFGVLGTVFFNLLYASLSYLIFRYNFFDYCLSWRHFIEIGLNGLLTFIFGSLFLIIKKLKGHETQF